jgi:hypothetical protein
MGLGMAEKRANGKGSKVRRGRNVGLGEVALWRFEVIDALPA